ncbi:MAG TPA: hypothetical protein VGM03_11950 [Phycisphaerae bacterium]|jgi:hypothetical protein
MSVAITDSVLRDRIVMATGIEFISNEYVAMAQVVGGNGNR